MGIKSRVDFTSIVNELAGELQQSIVERGSKAVDSGIEELMSRTIVLDGKKTKIDATGLKDEVNRTIRNLFVNNKDFKITPVKGINLSDYIDVGDKTLTKEIERLQSQILKTDNDKLEKELSKRFAAAFIVAQNRGLQIAKNEKYEADYIDVKDLLKIDESDLKTFQKQLAVSQLYTKKSLDDTLAYISDELKTPLDSNKIKIFDGYKEYIYDITRDTEALIEKLMSMAEIMKSPVAHSGLLKDGVPVAKADTFGDFKNGKVGLDSPGTGLYVSQNFDSVIYRHMTGGEGERSESAVKAARLYALDMADQIQNMLSVSNEEALSVYLNIIEDLNKNVLTVSDSEYRYSFRSADEIYRKYAEYFEQLNITIEDISEVVNSGIKYVNDLLKNPDKLADADFTSSYFAKNLFHVSGINVGNTVNSDSSNVGSVIFDHKKSPYIDFGNNEEIYKVFSYMVSQNILQNKASLSDISGSDIDEQIQQVFYQLNYDITKFSSEFIENLKNRISENIAKKSKEMMASKTSVPDADIYQFDIDELISSFSIIKDIRETYAQLVTDLGNASSGRQALDTLRRMGVKRQGGAPDWFKQSMLGAQDSVKNGISVEPEVDPEEFASRVTEILRGSGATAKIDVVPFGDSASGSGTTFADIINQWAQAPKILEGDDRERLAFLNSKTGFVSNSYLQGDFGEISGDIITKLLAYTRATSNEILDTFVHSHGEFKKAAFSSEDIESLFEDFNDGISKYVVVAMDEIATIDLSNVEEAMLDRLKQDLLDATKRGILKANQTKLKGKSKQNYLQSAISNQQMQVLSDPRYYKSGYANTSGVYSKSKFIDLLNTGELFAKANQSVLNSAARSYQKKSGVGRQGSDISFENIIKQVPGMVTASSLKDILQVEDLFPNLEQGGKEFEAELQRIAQGIISLYSQGKTSGEEFVSYLKEYFSLANKLNSGNQDISSEIEADVFSDIDHNGEVAKQRLDGLKDSESDVKASTEDALNPLVTEASNFRDIADSAERAADAKDAFTEANRRMHDSIDPSVVGLLKESEALEEVRQDLSDGKTDTPTSFSNPNPDLLKKVQDYLGKNPLEIRTALDKEALFAEIDKIAPEIAEDYNRQFNTNITGSQAASAIKKTINAQIKERERAEKEAQKSQEKLAQEEIARAKKVADEKIKEEARVAKEAEKSRKQIEAQALKQNKSANSKLDQAENWLSYLNPNSYTQDFANRIREIASEVSNLKSENLDFNTDEAQSQLTKVIDQVEELKRTLKVDSSSVELVDDRYLAKVSSKLSDIWKNASGMSSSSRAMFEDLKLRVRELQDGADISRKEVIDLDKEVEKLKSNIKDKGEFNKSFLSIFGDRLQGLNAQFIAQYFSFADWLRYARQAVDVIVELDSSLTELRKVSDASNARLQQSFEQSAATAKKLGSSIGDVVNVTAD